MNGITVIGSMNMDIILEVPFMPESGQNIYALASRFVCGGKGANAAIALKKLGSDVMFYGCVGSDAAGRQLLRNLEGFGVDTSAIGRKEGATGTAYILLEPEGRNRIIVVPGANERMNADDIRNVVTPFIRQSQVVLMQLEIAPECIQEVIKTCVRYGVRLVIDAGPVRGIKARDLTGAFCISPNETELEALLGHSLSTDYSVEHAAQELLHITRACQVVVKLGDKGCYYLSKEERFLMPAYNVPVVDTTAAGDSFTAGYCLALAKGETARCAVEYASRCGAVAVTRMGAASSLPSEEDLEHFPDFLQGIRRHGTE